MARTQLTRPSAPVTQRAAKPPSTGAMAGPAQARLARVGHMLNAAPAAQRMAAAGASLNQSRGVVQRIVINLPGGFGSRGRAGPHNSAGNRNALAEIRLHRAMFPSDALRHVNNEHENALVMGLPHIALHMAHHVSDAVVQETVVAAANAYNAGPPGMGAWAAVIALINGITPPPGIAAAMPVFYAEALGSQANANFALAAVTAVHPLPNNAAAAVHLTALAHAIANSPMNLHMGGGPTNMSLGRHGDHNNYASPMGLGGRRMSWRSGQMRAAVAGFGPNPLDERNLPTAIGMGGTLAGAQGGAFPVPGGLPPGAFVHNSATPNHFAIPN